MNDNFCLHPPRADGPSNVAPTTAPTPDLSSDSSDSYTDDDARHFLREWRDAKDRYYEATRENGQLEICLAVSQAALFTIEEEASVAQVKLAKSDAMVAGKLSSKKTFILIFTTPFLTIFLLL